MINAPQTARTEPARLFTRATVSAAVLAVVILLVDLLTPEGSGIGMLYVLPLFVGTLSGPPRFQLVAAGVASVLTFLGAVLPPHGALTGLVVANRTIALAIIWATAVVLSRFRRTWLTLQARTKELADIDYALDQSAIVATTDIRGGPSPTSTTSSARSPSTREKNCSARITGSSIPGITPRSSSGISG